MGSGWMYNTGGWRSTPIRLMKQARLDGLEDVVGRLDSHTPRKSDTASQAYKGIKIVHVFLGSQILTEGRCRSHKGAALVSSLVITLNLR